MVRCGQHISAKQQVTVNIEVFDLRAVVGIHVREHSAEPFDRCRSCGSRYEKDVFRDGAIQGGEEPLRTERAEQRGIDPVDISKPDRSVRWIHKIGAYLKACPWSEEYGSARRVAVEETRRQQVRCGASVWNCVPVDLAAAMGKCAAYSVVGSEIAKFRKASTAVWISAGVAPDASNTCGSAEAIIGWKTSVKPKAAAAAKRLIELSCIGFVF